MKRTTHGNPEEEEAVAVIKKAGGHIAVDEESPDKPVIEVSLPWTNVTNAGLVHLKELPHLQVLRLFDPDLIGLLGLLIPRHLCVLDGVLVHLKGLTQLQSLELNGTQITDAGLVHLKGLTQLQSLYLHETKVTDEGVRKLQQALPNCEIILVR